MDTPLITARDVAKRLGISEWDDDAAETQAKEYCVDVLDLIRSRRPSIDDWVAAGKVLRSTVVRVASQAVQRALFTAETGGIPKVGESHPEHSVQWNQASKGGLYLDDADLDDITPTDDATRRGAFTIRPR